MIGQGRNQGTLALDEDLSVRGMLHVYRGDYTQVLEFYPTLISIVFVIHTRNGKKHLRVSRADIHLASDPGPKYKEFLDHLKQELGLGRLENIPIPLNKVKERCEENLEILFMEKEEKERFGFSPEIVVSIQVPKETSDSSILKMENSIKASILGARKNEKKATNSINEDPNEFLKFVSVLFGHLYEEHKGKGGFEVKGEIEINNLQSEVVEESFTIKEGKGLSETIGLGQNHSFSNEVGIKFEIPDESKDEFVGELIRWIYENSGYMKPERGDLRVSVRSWSDNEDDETPTVVFVNIKPVRWKDGKGRAELRLPIDLIRITTDVYLKLSIGQEREKAKIVTAYPMEVVIASERAILESRERKATEEERTGLDLVKEKLSLVTSRVEEKIEQVSQENTRKKALLLLQLLKMLKEEIESSESVVLALRKSEMCLKIKENRSFYPVLKEKFDLDADTMWAIDLVGNKEPHHAQDGILVRTIVATNDKEEKTKLGWEKFPETVRQIWIAMAKIADYLVLEEAKKEKKHLDLELKDVSADVKETYRESEVEGELIFVPKRSLYWRQYWGEEIIGGRPIHLKVLL